MIRHADLIQLSLFALTVTTLWMAETALSAGNAVFKWRHAKLNSLFIMTALPIQFVMTVLCFGLAKWTAGAHWGLVYLLKNPGNPFVKYVLMFVVLDLLDYVYHLAMHYIPLFWRFHLVHHSDLAVDVSTTVREHPGETFIRNGFLLLWVLLTGASLEVLVIRQMVETASNIAAHTSIRLPPRPARILGWLFVTPNFHHAHHHCERPATNRNFGDVFSIWDRLFGTVAAIPPEKIVFGLDTHLDGRTDDRLMAWSARLGWIARAIRSGLDSKAVVDREAGVLTNSAAPVTPTP